MTDNLVTMSAGKKPAAKIGKKARAKPTHPRTADMVNAAIKSLKDRSGSSLQAIKKYINATYKIDAEKQAPFIKKYIKAAVENGGLVQTKGKGAAGSFKLSVHGEVKGRSKPVKKITRAKAPASPKKIRTPVKKVTKSPRAVKKVEVVKKVAEKKKVKSPVVKSSKVKVKSPVKSVKKVKKSPVKAKGGKKVKKVVKKK